MFCRHKWKLIGWHYLNVYEQIFAYRVFIRTETRCRIVCYKCGKTKTPRLSKDKLDEETVDIILRARYPHEF